MFQANEGLLWQSANHQNYRVVFLISCYRARALRHSVIVSAIRITKRTKTVFVLQVEENVAEEEMFSSQLLPDHRACYCECVCINV